MLPGLATASLQIRLWTPHTLHGDGDMSGVQQRSLWHDHPSPPQIPAVNLLSKTPPPVAATGRLNTHHSGSTSGALRGPLPLPLPHPSVPPFLFLCLSLPPVLLWTVKQEGPFTCRPFTVVLQEFALSHLAQSRSTQQGPS